MSEETREQSGPTYPDDVRTPGPGGGEQPATLLETGRPVPEFSAQPTGRDNRFDNDPNPETTGKDVNPARDFKSEEKERVDVLYVPLEKISVMEMRDNARSYYKDDSLYVLDVGTEIFNQSGARILLRSPAVIQLGNATSNPQASDTKFAGFLHDSQKNWELNIGQMERPFNRATATPIVLTCEPHGEDLELAPYGAPRQCPKCAQEALEKAQFDAEINTLNKRLAEENAASDAPATPAPPDISIEPIKVGDVVVLNMDEPDLAEMTVISVEHGMANCKWFDADGQLREKLYGVTILRKVR